MDADQNRKGHMIETERLALRRFAADDASELFAIAEASVPGG